MEILFEQDNEEKSVASLILDCLVKVESHYTVMDKELDWCFLCLYLPWRQHSEDSRVTESSISVYFMNIGTDQTTFCQIKEFLLRSSVPMSKNIDALPKGM